MKKFHTLVMRASYILGLLFMLAGAVVRLAWFYHYGLGHDPRRWFICAGALFLCSLASYHMNLLEKE